MANKVINKFVRILSSFMKKYTSLMIKSIYDFEKLVKDTPKLIVIFGSPDCEWCHKILFRYPILLYKARKVKAILRFCNITSEKSKCFADIWIINTPTLRLYENGKLIKSIEHENKIFSYFKNI